MRRTISMSFLLYTRWPVLDFSGARFGNSLSQKRRTKGSISTILQTSPILKKSLSGIGGIDIKTVAAVYDRRRFRKRDTVGGHRPPLQLLRSLRALLDYNGRPREWKSF